jgi:hypothetical protein
MPAVNKYDLYSDYISDNRQPNDPFFGTIRPLEKNYLFVDTKDILEKELIKGELDIFYSDDTHWSFKASKAIVQHFIYDLK